MKGSVMKKLIAVLLLLTLLCLAACAKKEDGATVSTTEAGFDRLAVGMRYDEVERLTIEHVDAFNLVFCRDEAGNSLVGEYGTDDGRICAVRSFPAVTADAAAFASVSVGMEIFDVVERVGVPVGARTFGLASLDFACTDGTEYRIVLDGNLQVAEVSRLADGK